MSGAAAARPRHRAALDPSVVFDRDGGGVPDAPGIGGRGHMPRALVLSVLAGHGAPGAMRIPGLTPGLKGERRVLVTEAMTTTHAGGRILPTPSMIMEMEATAQDVTEPYLPLGHTTGGYEICIRHRRPTPLGEWFTVAAELVEVVGRRLLFRVEASSAREQIGEGTLRRTVVLLGTLA